jgi:hypothetical protein
MKKVNLSHLITHKIGYSLKKNAAKNLSKMNLCTPSMLLSLINYEYVEIIKMQSIKQIVFFF